MKPSLECSFSLNVALKGSKRGMEGEREERLFISVPGRAADLITTPPWEKVTAQVSGWRDSFFLYVFLFLTGHRIFHGWTFLSCSFPYQTFKNVSPSLPAENWAEATCSTSVFCSGGYWFWHHLQWLCLQFHRGPRGHPYDEVTDHISI